MGWWPRFVGSRSAAIVAALWGFAEATCFFIVPDVWIGLLALFSWRSGLRAVAFAIVGALVGGALTFGVGARLTPQRSAQLLAAVPAISPAMIARIDREMRERGPRSMLLGSLQGTPYKIYARTAGSQGQAVLAFLLWSIPARGARFLLIAALAAAFGALMRGRAVHPGWIVPPYLVLWIVFYAWYFRTYGF